MDKKQENGIVDKDSSDNVNKELSKMIWCRNREITFFIMTLIFVGIAIILYFASFYVAPLLMQLCVGAATGCFVVTLQEDAQCQQYKFENKRITTKNKSSDVNISKNCIEEHKGIKTGIKTNIQEKEQE